MSKLEVDTIAPQSGTTLTVGESGDTVTIPTGATFDASNATTTLPATVVTTTGSQTLTNKSIDSDNNTITNIVNADIKAAAAIDYSKLNLTGNIALADLSATGTKDATTFLRGDNSFAVPPLGGITEADQWRLSASFSTGDSIITSNLERNDSSFSYIGTGMTESSGVFTFPSTGIWLIDFNASANATSAGDIRYAGGRILATTNNSSYTDMGETFNGCNNHGLPYYFSSNVKIFFDVTDTSTHKVKFRVLASATVDFQGATTENRTHMTFIRLGDT